MKLKFIVFILFIVLTLNNFVHAQSGIKGLVRDEMTLNPVEFATIVIQNRDVGV